MPPSSHSAEPRAARLEARLALYAQYASLVAEEVAAAWSTDPAHAGTVPRELAQERAELAERYEALRGGAPGPDGFDTVLAEAVTELDHQAAVERSLRDRIEGLHHSLQYGLPPGERVLGAGEAEAVADDVVEPVGDEADDAHDADDVVEDEGCGALPAGIGGALVTARSRGVGGSLAGQFPGIVAGAASAFGGALAGVDAVAGAAPRAQVDLTF